MDFDVHINNDIISIKEQLKPCLNPEYSEYIENILYKNIKDCNLLYTQVCYLIKLFVLYEFENNNNKINIEFNNNFIIFCFNLIKNGHPNKNDYTDKNKLKVINYYNDNKELFKIPKDVSSISHIINGLATDIITNIKNNITLNFYKYLREYIKININIEFKNDVKSYDITNIFNDIIYNTLNSDIKYHSWINKNKKFIIPDFSNDIIKIDSLKSNNEQNNKIIKKFIMNYIKNNEDFSVLCINNNIKNDNKNKLYDKVYNDFINDTLLSNNVFHSWILSNKNIIINNFNSENFIDIDEKISLTPCIFIENMIYINKNLELNKSKKHYQIIPQRTNLTPKFIPINTHALVDIIDSKKLDNIKNYYHNNTLNGLEVWNKFFLFNSKYILNSLKKGYTFSGTIMTNGYEIIYLYYSKKQIEFKNKFHEAGKTEKKNIKNLLKDVPDDEKEEVKLRYDNEKKENKKLKEKEKKELLKIKNEDEKKSNEALLELIKNDLDNLSKAFKEKCNNLQKDYADKIKELGESEAEKDKYKSLIAYLTHCYNRDKLTLIDDYNNDINIKYENLFINDQTLNNEIAQIKLNIKTLKKSLKKFKNKTKKNLLNKYDNSKTIKYIKKIKNLKDNLEFVCKGTEYHIDRIKENLFNILNIVKEEYNLIDIKTDSKNILNLKKISNEILEILILKAKNNKNNFIGISIKIKKGLEYNNEYYEILEKIKNKNEELSYKINIQQKNNIAIRDLFKNRNNEYLKIDNMSKKHLEIVNKLNWTVIDPGINSLFYMLSKDGKTKFNYSKKMHNNRISLYKIQNKMIKIKNEEIQKLEDSISKDENRQKTSNNYENFKNYFIKKMLLHERLEVLYNDVRINKLKWNLYINEKRAQKLLINDIKLKFGNDVVLIIGDWSMNKSMIRGISPTPNKKYTRLLEDNFITLKINEFRTSVLHNKYELKCENLVKKYDSKNENIKKVFSLENIKSKDEDKYKEYTKDKKIHKILFCKANRELNEYVNRDKNSVMNMVKIVNSYLETNYRPINFIMGTQPLKGLA